MYVICVLLCSYCAAYLAITDTASAFATLQNSVRKACADVGGMVTERKIQCAPAPVGILTRMVDAVFLANESGEQILQLRFELKVAARRNPAAAGAIRADTSSP